MRRTPDVSLIVSSFERPAFLGRCLQSVATQAGIEGRLEVVVADDGSRDGTEDVVLQFALATGLPTKFTSHPHDGFRLARCRNEGVLASTGEYLLFTDGDCVLPNDHVARHLRSRRRGWVMAGDCYRLDAETSEALCVDAIRSGDPAPRIGRRAAGRAFWKRVKSCCYELLRIPMRPRLSGSNIGVWREDCQRVNGFDENFVGWGMEDTDFQRRLESIGVRSTWTRTSVYHLWHPPHSTYSHNSRGTANYRYYHRAGTHPIRCSHGLEERRRAGFRCRTFDPGVQLLAGGQTPGD